MDGIGSFFNRIRRIFYRYHDYHYNRFSLIGKMRSRLDSSSRPVSLAMILVVSVGSLYFVTASLTGFVTYTGNIESELSDANSMIESLEEEKAVCANSLDSAASALEQCNENFGSSSSSLQQCQNEKNTIEASYNQLDADYSLCNAERADYKSLYEKESENFNVVVRNSVRGVCCSAFDVINNKVNDWSIADNIIKCGEVGYTVNCGTGETSY